MVMGDSDEGKMTFLEHLGELRTRIIWSLVPTLIGLLVAFRFFDLIIKFIARPLTARGSQLVFLSPTEAFWTSMKISIVAGVCLAMPVILWQVWAFVAPGLHQHERRFAGPDETVATMAVPATGQALARAGIAARDLDVIIVATATPDHPIPSTACYLQALLDAPRAAAFDISAACSGFVYGLTMAEALIPGA